MNATMPERDFWLSSGHRLLRRRDDGRLAITDDFLRAYLARPELRPGDDSCAAEIGLHQALAAEPRCRVADETLASLADEDARENYRVFLDFRDLLLGQDTLEASYLALFRGGRAAIPPLFLDQLTHVILRGILNGCRDPFRLRAAELLFRSQTASIGDSAVLLADEEILQMRAARAKQSRELLQPAAAPVEIEMDLLSEANAAEYWQRSDRFDMALNVGFTQPGLDALCRVLEAWVGHFLAASVSVHPVQRIRDERWVWHVGLDAEATSILNRLYHGEALPEATTARILSLFRLEFRDPGDMRPDIAGRPVYLAMAMDERSRLRLKPQNLLAGLPLRVST